MSVPIICYGCKKKIELGEPFTPGKKGYAHIGHHKNNDLTPMTLDEHDYIEKKIRKPPQEKTYE